MPRVELFPFRYRDPRTGKWIRARYRAEWREIEKRYVEFEIAGPPEIRDVDPEARYFSPHASFKAMMSAELKRHGERPPELQPAIDAAEAFLVLTFLRRYVTYCARRRRFAANERGGAAARSVGASYLTGSKYLDQEPLPAFARRLSRSAALKCAVGEWICLLRSRSTIPPCWGLVGKCHDTEMDRR